MIEMVDYSKNIGKSEVLKDLNLVFEEGMIYGIVGPNGSGKTMLLRAIAGLIKPTSGKVIIDGKLLHKEISFPPNMGILIEAPELLGHLSGLENLELLSKIRNVVSLETIKNLMTEFGLDPNDKKTVRKYSLGMKQKIGIIQAIMENQKLLILDEPFNALDSKTVDLVREKLLKFRNEGKTILISSHHNEDIINLCDKVILIEDGTVISIQ